MGDLHEGTCAIWNLWLWLIAFWFSRFCAFDISYLVVTCVHIGLVSVNKLQLMSGDCVSVLPSSVFFVRQNDVS